MAVSLPMARKREDNVVLFGIDELEGRLRALIEEVTFAADSLLEEAGFEPSVPRDRRFREGLMSALLDSPPTERRRKREPMPRLRRGLPRDRWFESSSLPPDLSRIISRHGWPAPPPADGRLPREPAASARRSVG